MISNDKNCFHIQWFMQLFSHTVVYALDYLLKDRMSYVRSLTFHIPNPGMHFHPTCVV